MTTNRVRLTTDQKMRALALLARGDTLSQVAGYIFETWQLSISEAALSNMRQKNKDIITHMQQVVADGQSAEADDLAKRARRLISRRLDKAERDTNTLEELDQQWRDGEIKNAEDYRRRKAGLLKVGIRELVAISKAMHSQSATTPPPPGSPALPPGAALPPLATPAHLEAMLQAIAAGNTVELQRLTFTPGAPPRDITVQV